MDTRRKALYLLVVIATLSILIACTSKTAPTQYVFQQSFVESLNSQSVDSLDHQISYPLTISSHQWQSAQDGSGFILGDYKKTVIGNINELTQFLNNPKTPLKSISLQGRPISNYSLYKQELGQDSQLWTQLNSTVYLKGQGDVEHILIVGIDPNTSKVTAIYYN